MVDILKKTIAKISFRIMERIARKSGLMTLDLVVDHELSGVPPEMIDYWWDNIDSTERYKLWHPKDHKYFIWETSPKNGHVGFPTLLRVRWEDISINPIPAEYDHVLVASVLDSKDKRMSWFIHEYELIGNGTRLRTTFRLPAKVPQWVIKALRKHNIEKIGEFTNFLPKLYKKKGGIETTR